MPQHVNFSVKPMLTGDKVVLRPFQDGDLATFRAALTDQKFAG